MKVCTRGGILILCLFQTVSLLHAQSYYKEVPFEVEDGKMFVNVLLNDKPYRFLLDTGASGYGRIDSTLVTDLGLQITGTSTNFDGTNRASINNVTVENISFAGIEHENVTLYSRNFNRPGREDKKRLYGVIGFRFWEAYMLEIDYKQKKLIFSDKSLSSQDENTISYSRSFVVPLQIGEIEVQAHIDTGSFLTLLFPMEYAERSNISELEEAGKARSAYTNFVYWRATVYDEIEILGNVERNVEAVFSDIITHVNIGMGYLKDYHLTIDQKNHLIRLKKVS